MRYSTITGTVLAVCILAFSQASPAAGDVNAMHGYNCRYVSANSPYGEIPGGFQSGKFVNISGASAYLICPMNCETGNNAYAIYLSTSASCLLAKTNLGGGSTTYYNPTASGSGTGYNYYVYSSVVTCNYATPLEIQCFVPAGTSAFGLYSY